MIYKSILGATALVLSASVNAAIVTHGYLTTDDTTNFILDTNTGRQYLRFDAYRLGYADTVTATNAGGIYEGWSIATSDIADQFYSGLFGTGATQCTGLADHGEICGELSGWADDSFGVSMSGQSDAFFFLSTNPTNNMTEAEVGYGHISLGYVRDYDDWSTLFSSEVFAVSAMSPISFLLYKETSIETFKEASVVPVPAAIWLFGSGLLGLIGTARRKMRT